MAVQAIDQYELGVSQGNQVANYYYGALAPLDFYAPPITPRVVNGSPYNGQFAVTAPSALGNPSGVFPGYGGPANGYLGGPGANFGSYCDPAMMSCACAVPASATGGSPAPNCIWNGCYWIPANPSNPAPAPQAACDIAKNANNGFGGNSVSARCPCTNVYNPVCSSAGVTYANYCRANCHGATTVTHGPCFSFNYVATCNGTCNCNDETSLVCSPRGVTFENACVAKCSGADSVLPLQCEAPCRCQYSFDPVCSKTGKNYVSLCFLQCAKEELLFKGPCSKYNPTSDPCSKCDNTLSPVCGMDGNTYTNACQLTCKNTTTIRYHGDCPKYVNGVCTCPSNFLPVCSSDGTTFDNYCKLFCASKTFAYMGQCMAPGSSGANGFNPACLRNCATAGWNPLCGTDNLTYGNQCAMTCKLSGAVSPVQSGPCNPVVNSFCRCDSTIDLVCGADGKTYLNPCQLNCVSVNRKGPGACDAIGNYGSLLDWFRTNGVGANFVHPTGYSILKDPHVFIPGPYDPEAGKKKKKNNQSDDDSDSGYDSDKRRDKGKGKWSRKTIPAEEDCSSERRRPAGPTSFTLIGDTK